MILRIKLFYCFQVILFFIINVIKFNCAKIKKSSLNKRFSDNLYENINPINPSHYDYDTTLTGVYAQWPNPLAHQNSNPSSSDYENRHHHHYPSSPAYRSYPMLPAHHNSKVHLIYYVPASKKFDIGHILWPVLIVILLPIILATLFLPLAFIFFNFFTFSLMMRPNLLNSVNGMGAMANITRKKRSLIQDEYIDTITKIFWKSIKDFNTNRL